MLEQMRVDVMLMHGGANTFHETVLAGIPVLVWPVFGDQESVAETAGKLGIGVPIENLPRRGLVARPSG